jgi:hypothetical protein
VRYFGRHGYTGAGPDISEQYPGFRMTNLDQHLHGLWPASA